MKPKRNTTRRKTEPFATKLKKGDPVMVVAGGNTKKGRELKGVTGKILRFLPKKNRVIVEGVNIIKRHKKATTAQDSSGIIEKEGSIHISNVMYYNEESRKPVRIKYERLEDGRKVRGFINPKTQQFEQIELE